MPFIFTNRLGGVSKDPFASANLGDHVGDDLDSVIENRAQLESQIGMPIVFMNQVHGDTVVLVEKKIKYSNLRFINHYRTKIGSCCDGCRLHSITIEI